MSANQAIAPQIDHDVNPPVTRGSDTTPEAPQECSRPIPVPGLVRHDQAAQTVPHRGPEQNVIARLRRLPMSGSAGMGSEPVCTHGAPGHPVHSGVIRRVRYADASQEFERSKRLETMLDSFEDHNQAVEDEDADDVGETYSKMVKFCPDLPNLPKADRWKKEDVPELKDYTPKSSLENLKVVTQCPSPLTNDRVLLKTGERFAHLQMILKTSFHESTGAAFAKYVDMHVQHYTNLRKQLGTEESKLDGLWKSKLDRTTIEFESLAADAHGFAPPTALTMQADGEPTKKFVHKSRPGQIDKLVTELFNEINKLIGGSQALPYYKQEVFSNGHLISEFIEGAQLDAKIEWQAGAGTKKGLDTLVSEKEVFKRAQLEGQLKLLQLVAKKIGLTDLHEENLIYDPASNMVVPIDLEAFDEGAATGLYGHNPEPSLTWKDFRHDIQQCSDAIDRLIEKFNEVKDRVERRLVPVPTGELKNMLDGDGPSDEKAIKTTTQRIELFLLKRRFVVKKEILGDYVGKCKQIGAVPSFTTIDRLVLTSSLNGSERSVIAERMK